MTGSWYRNVNQSIYLANLSSQGWDFAALVATADINANTNINCTGSLNLTSDNAMLIRDPWYLDLPQFQGHADRIVNGTITEGCVVSLRRNLEDDGIERTIEIMIHELSHCVGLTHIADPREVMYETGCLIGGPCDLTPQAVQGYSVHY